jgi:hypothetical protein
MPQTQKTRILVIAGGALVIAGCFLAACLASWMFLEAGGSGMLGEGRLFMVLPLAPLTALGVAVMGTKWTRRVHPSTAESLSALLIIEVIILGLVAGATGDLFMDITFMFWVIVSLPFAPWWLLGLWIGRAVGRRRSV